MCITTLTYFYQLISGIQASYEEEVEGQNELLCQILAVVEPLVGYGFYREDPDIAETLISVLVLPVKANGEGMVTTL